MLPKILVEKWKQAHKSLPSTLFDAYFLHLAFESDLVEQVI